MSAELRCSHSRLIVHSIEPCLFCERDRLRESNAALLALARQYASECAVCLQYARMGRQWAPL